MPKRLAIVTGANRGIGFEVVRQLSQNPDIQVLMAVRDTAKGHEALQVGGLSNVAVAALDVSDSDSIQAFCRQTAAQWGRADILINNAGIFQDRTPGLSAPVEAVLDTFRTNTFGPLMLMQSLIPLMRRYHYGRIVNVSSGLGALHDMGGGYLSYRASKTALNAITRILADEVQGKGILINAVCPGWVQTDMGGKGAPRSIEQGADTILWLATLPEDGPNGGFFRDRQAIEW